MKTLSTNLANTQRDPIWRKCPICERGGYVDGRHGTDFPSPEFDSFIALIRHLVDHQELAADPTPPPDLIDLLWHEIDLLWAELNKLQGRPRDARPGGPRGGREARVSAGIRRLLPSIANWLRDALKTIPELDRRYNAGPRLSERLPALIGGLTDNFSEQREYLLRHKKTLQQAAGDKKWPSTPARQASFLAESMAGAEWGLTASSSREYIRLEKPKSRKTRENTALGEGRWWEKGSGRPSHPHRE